MRPDPVVVIAGSREMPALAAPRVLVPFLARLPQTATILLRRGAGTPAGLFEAQAAKICEIIGFRVEWREPEPVADRDIWSDFFAEEAPKHFGRAATFARDLALVLEADLVLCFYAPRQAGDSSSGTYALVEKAIEEDRVVYAYTIDKEGRLCRDGENDPSNEWGDLVPRPD